MMLLNCCGNSTNYQIAHTVFFGILGIIFLISLIRCRNDEWPSKHRFLYAIYGFLLLQFPFVAMPLTIWLGWDVSCIIPTVIAIIVSFIIFIPGYTKWLKIIGDHEPKKKKEEIDYE